MIRFHWTGAWLLALLWGCGGITIRHENITRLSAVDSLMVKSSQERAVDFPVPHSAWFSVGKNTTPVYSWSYQGVAYTFKSDESVFILNRYGGEFYVVTFDYSDFHAFVYRGGKWQALSPGQFPAEIALYNYSGLLLDDPGRDAWYEWTREGDAWQPAFLAWLRTGQPGLASDSTFCLRHLKKRWGLLCPQEEDSLARLEGYAAILWPRLDSATQGSLCRALKLPSSSCKLNLEEAISWRGEEIWLLEADIYPPEVFVVVRQGETFTPLLHKVNFVVDEYVQRSRLFAAPNPDSSRLAFNLVSWNNAGVEDSVLFVAPRAPRSAPRVP